MAKKTHELALCGVLCALAVAFLWLSGVIPLSTYAWPILASATLLPAREECRKSYAWSCFAASAILGLLQNLSGQSAQFVASLAVLTTIVSASGGMNALQIGLQRLTPGSHRTFLNRLLAIGYTFVFELLLLVMLALQGMHSLFARFADTLPFFRHYAAIVAPLQRVASIGRIVSVPLLFGLLLLIYTYVPGGRRTPRSQLPGTIFATAGWLVFSRVFSFYILHFWRLSYIYGSLTAVILIILWLYVIINLLFLGAGLNAEVNGKTEQ